MSTAAKLQVNAKQILQHNRHTKQHNARLFMARKKLDDAEWDRFANSLIPHLQRSYAARNEQTRARNAAYEQLQRDVAQRKAEHAERVALNLQRQAERTAQHRALVQQHHEFMSAKRKAVASVKKAARLQFLQALNEDCMSWSVSPAELDFARYRIVTPARFRLFDH